LDFESFLRLFSYTYMTKYYRLQFSMSVYNTSFTQIVLVLSTPFKDI